jgi:L-cysteine/cystine lyase
MTFAEARSAFPVLERVAYLNAGTFGPLARRTVEVMQERQRHDLDRGRTGPEYFAEVNRLRDQARERLARLLGVATEHVALVTSTSDACQIVVAGLSVGPQDEIVTTDSEHFGLLGALHSSRARVTVAAPSPDAILGEVTPRTRLLALSHVLWTTGNVLPVHRLKEETGLPVLVDGAQSVGAIDVAAQGVDFYTVSGQKWLCGPDSTGGLYVAEPERLRVARPTYFAQESYDRDGSFRPRPGAARFDSWWIPPAALAGLVAAIDEAPGWRLERTVAIAGECRELLGARFEVVTAPRQSGLVSFRPRGDPAGVATRLYERGVVVRDVPGRDLVRASCGYWTSSDDLERLLDALQ